MDAALDQEFMPLVTPEELPELEELGWPMHRLPGETFFREGEYGDFALLLVKGCVKVTQGSPSRIIDVRGPGAIVGEMAVLRRKPRMASVIAWDEVEALYLPGSSWKGFLYAHARALHALVIMTEDMAERQGRKVVESELAIEHQLAMRLIELADLGLGLARDDGSLVFTGVSQRDLSSLIGVKKIDSVKKIIGQLKASGIVDTGRQMITILEPAILRQIADGNRTAS